MSEGGNIFSNYFDYNIFLLKLTAFWVYDNKTIKCKRYLQHTYNLFWCIYMFIGYIPTEILYAFYSFGDLNQFLRALRDIGNHISLAYKTTNYFLRREDLLNLINILQHGNYHYEDYGSFQPKSIVERKKKEAVRWTTYFWYFCNAICFCMFVTGLYTFFVLGDKQYIIKDGQKIYNQPQPVVIVSPFGSGTRPKFFATFIHTIICLTFLAWMIVGRLTILVAEKLESIYNVQTLFQTFISLGEMCFCLYILSETNDQNVGNELTYLIATGFELLLYCWFGDRITEASIEVSYSLYDSDWFSTNLSFRKQIIFTMTRMKRPIYVTIGKITPLTFNTFLTVILIWPEEHIRFSLF
ncbi:7tm 6 domain containing protein [Asbolus verrucosus]|uniref:Odorant receptor n=1 Tax=Asbolus verrucosus TaxID=1661398 RepID=A0A482WEZ4_ASBVE|nr:7tm 6 domain containing protein [Asbolus verrucosus]